MGLSYSAVSTIRQNWREHPPSYSLKIQNFSQLEKSTAFSNHKYQSRLFSSDGYNWRLIIYPKGNVKDNGSGFISMYVEIDSSSLIESTEVFAELRFFVYNKKYNKYFTIQDVEVKRFNALKTVWGLPQVLSLATLINPENGYIFEGGECEFGVDVIVAPPFTNWEVLSFDVKLSDPKFSWTLKKFSELKEEFYTSNSFSMGGMKWVLKMYPKGNVRADGKYLSLFLYLADSETLKPDEKIFKKAHVRVLDPLGYNHLTEKLSHWHNESNHGYGWPCFVSLTELRETYLNKEDALTVEVEFKVVSKNKYSPII
ncbi:Ubiquitin C-terminal hydrolase 12 [Cardamine amara subsp. amara]|uniref:Ubiquitin C-terminal hydrolase 12 n=1 Tax=Cardamine amara subsp. amara TaxID=228776 RepID=A0ABD0ZK93_CARAN